MSAFFSVCKFDNNHLTEGYDELFTTANAIFRVEKNTHTFILFFVSDLTDRKLKQISPEATSFHFSTINCEGSTVTLRCGICFTGSLSATETARCYLKAGEV